MSDSSIPRISGAIPVSLAGLKSPTAVRTVLIMLLCASFGVLVQRMFLVPPNGDEYIFLSNIHRGAHGWPLGLLQTAHVHLFWWLPYAGQDEVVQNLVGRGINLGLWAVSLVLLHRLGRRLLDPLGAAVGVVLFAVLSTSVANAGDFRIDGLVLPVLLSVALLLLEPTIGRVAAAGVLSAVALAFTIKSVLWAPAFVGVLAVGLWDRQRPLRAVLAGTMAGTATFIGIMLAHRWAISTEPSSGPGVSVDGLAHIGSYMFFEGIFPAWPVLAGALVQNPATWILMALGVGLAIAGVGEPMSRRNSLILLFLALPVLSLTFYTNAFGYAYLVLLPTACLLAGMAFSRFMGAAGGLRGVTAFICLFSAAIPMTAYSWNLRADHTQQYRQVISTVHQLFEDPVFYIDISGAVASFPRRMPEITRAVLSGYRRAGVPAVTNYIREYHPPLMIANSTSLNVWAEEELESLDPDLRLLPEDEAALRATYAHYWDQIYLAGRQWSELGAGERHDFEIIVPGEHTLLSENPVMVDGRSYAPGATISLEAGPHELRTTAAEPDLRILWGKDLTLPAEESEP